MLALPGGYDAPFCSIPSYMMGISNCRYTHHETHFRTGQREAAAHPLCNYFVDDLSMHIGQSEISATVAEGEFFVI
jgi:hypothetical protein